MPYFLWEKIVFRLCTRTGMGITGFHLRISMNGWTELVARKVNGQLEVISDKVFQRLPNASVDVFSDDTENGVWFSKSDETLSL